jgi:enamine deaminase RidA (YjgF/YER057c/UK114 family)
VAVPVDSGFAPAARAGELVFVAGAMANDDSGIAPAARLRSGSRWGGTQVSLETDYIIHRQLSQSLEPAGSSLERVVKAQVYVSDVDDIPAFNRSWRAVYGSSPPATTIVPVSGLAIVGGVVEINVLALAADATARPERVEAARPSSYDGHPAAVRAGDLLFISGLSATDEHGLAPPATDVPYFGSSIETQMERILGEAEEICSAAGTSLRNVVRAQHFHADLGELYGAYGVWRHHFPDLPVPLSAVQVPAPLPVPGTSVIVDLWVYAPEG